MTHRIILLTLAGVAVLCAQEFEAASIKAVPCTGRCGGGGGIERLSFTPERVSNMPQGITARGIILEAYHLGAYQLRGGPAWLDSDRFALEAVTANPTDESQMRRMLQTLLADRFKLMMHHETSEMPVYFLTVGKKGAKLHERKDGDPPLALPPLGTGLAFMTKMDNFIAHISSFGHIDRPVLDKTGLDGVYDFFLPLTGDEDIKTAVEDAFGLKFESHKAPVDVFTIDHVERPSGN